MKVAEISGVLFASCSNKPKRGKKYDEFKSLYQNILKLLFCGHISLPSQKNTTSNFTSHGQEVRNLVKVPYWQCTCPSRSAHLIGTFGHGNISIPPLRAQNYSTIRLLTLRVKFDGISPRTPELEDLPWTTFIRCIWKILSPIKAPFAKKMLLFWSLHFLSAFFHKISSNVSRNMLEIQTESYFHLTRRNDPLQLQNCRTKRVLIDFWDFPCNLAPTERNSFSRTPTHPKTENVLSLFCKYERFIRFDTWGTAPLQRLCQNMVRTW